MILVCDRANFGRHAKLRESRSLDLRQLPFLRHVL
jgi:hypothetical protein